MTHAQVGAAALSEIYIIPSSPFFQQDLEHCAFYLGSGTFHPLPPPSKLLCSRIVASCCLAVLVRSQLSKALSGNVTFGRIAHTPTNCRGRASTVSVPHGSPSAKLADCPHQRFQSLQSPHDGRRRRPSGPKRRTFRPEREVFKN